MSILFVAQGSPLSRIAADVAIALAKEINCAITVQFVINPRRILELEGFEGVAGLCGSSVFVETGHDITALLARLGESLLMSFAALAEGQNIQVHQHIDVGDTAQEIVQRANMSQLTVLAGNEENLALAGTLMRALCSPVLFVLSPSNAMLLKPQRVEERAFLEIQRILGDANIRAALIKNSGGSSGKSIPTAA